MNDPVPIVKGEAKLVGQVLVLKEPMVCASSEWESPAERLGATDDYGKAVFELKAKGNFFKNRNSPC